MKFEDALEIVNPEIAVVDQTVQKLMKRLIADNAKLRAELDYHEKKALETNDAQQCAICDNVRYADDIIKPKDETYDLGGCCCCEDCAEKFLDEVREAKEQDKFEKELWERR